MEVDPYAAPAVVVVERGLLVLPIFGAGRRGRHDLIADTIVIDV